MASIPAPSGAFATRSAPRTGVLTTRRLVLAHIWLAFAARFVGGFLSPGAGDVDDADQRGKTMFLRDDGSCGDERFACADRFPVFLSDYAF